MADGDDQSDTTWRPAAVLWDMDGTLVDTEPYWMAAEHELVAEHGGVWTDADARSIVGFDLLDAARELRERGGVPLAERAIVETLLDRVIVRTLEHLPWRPGAAELLAECRRLDIACALVTMSWSRLARAVVDASPPGSFRAVVAGDAVEHGKPHPEPYLTAARVLGVAPSDCLAIEDSPTGVAAALAAGCRTLAVPHVVPVAPRPGLGFRQTLVGCSVDDAVDSVVAASR